MSTHGPIEEEHCAMINAIANGLDQIFNGDEKPKKVGFALLVFEFGESAERINYISNASRPEMLCAMKEFIARAEGRHIEETGQPIPEEQ